MVINSWVSTIDKCISSCWKMWYIFGKWNLSKHSVRVIAKIVCGSYFFFSTIFIVNTWISWNLLLEKIFAWMHWSRQNIFLLEIISDGVEQTDIQLLRVLADTRHHFAYNRMLQFFSEHPETIIFSWLVPGNGSVGCLFIGHLIRVWLLFSLNLNDSVPFGEKLGINRNMIIIQEFLNEKKDTIQSIFLDGAMKGRLYVL